jgi:hypothetical protein
LSPFISSVLQVFLACLGILGVAGAIWLFTRYRAGAFEENPYNFGVGLVLFGALTMAGVYGIICARRGDFDVPDTDPRSRAMASFSAKSRTLIGLGLLSLGVLLTVAPEYGPINGDLIADFGRGAIVWGTVHALYGVSEWTKERRQR